MSLTFFCGLLLGLSLLTGALVSLVLVVMGRFKTWWIMPYREGDQNNKGRTWFVIQACALMFAALIVFIRTNQVLENHYDNVMENLMYAVSGMLLVRAVGEFRVMGLFRTENEGSFARFDKNVLVPIAWLMFLLSLVLL
jgi:uncharacterized integral membrane protein